MTQRNPLRRLATSTVRLLHPSWDAPQQVARPDLFEDAATIALLNLRAEGMSAPRVNRDSTPWWQAPPPWPWHHCRAQTAELDATDEFVFRCPCGAIHGEPPHDLWVGRNGSRRH